MSDCYEALVDSQATEVDAEDLARKALDVLLQLEIINPAANSDCVLGGTGYPPGRAVPTIYALGENEYPFWKAGTNGVEITAGRWFNMFGTTVLEHILCPSCGADYAADEGFRDRFIEQVGKWLNREPTFAISCQQCGKEFQAKEWISKPHLGFSMLTLTFWNWPPLNLSSWRIDIPKLVGERLGHNLVRSWGRM